MKPLGWNIRGASNPRGTGAIRLTGPGHILTDIAWNSRDITVELWAAMDIQHKDTEYTSATVIFSTSDTVFTDPMQVIGGRDGGTGIHWYSSKSNHQQGRDIGCLVLKGSGDVFRWYFDPDMATLVYSDIKAPVMNSVKFDFSHYGWRDSKAITVNGKESSFNGGGDASFEFPSTPVALFAHANPDGSIFDIYGTRSRNCQYVHSVTFKSASTGEVLRDFVAKNKGGQIGMYDMVTKNFFPSTGSFEYVDNCEFAEQVA